MPGILRKKKKWDIAVWAVTSATAVLILIVALMALAQFRLRENQAVSLFIEKGSTLIASFEAGLRHSGPGVPDTFTFQKLLMETAQQPDIDHIIVTDSRGNVLADSNPAMLETKYGLDLDPLSLAAGREIRWRATPNPGGAGTFEVYRTLIPGRDRPAGGEGPWIIFVGFNMDKIERAVRDDKRGMVMVSLSLALVGSLAIISLFLAQSYRLTRASLSRVTVFSDALVKNMPIGVLALDSKEKIATCNEQVRDLLPCSCDDAIGRRIDELVARPFVDLLDGLAESETLIEKDIILQSGQEGENDTRVWEAVAARLRGEDAPEGKILLVRDVTAIRKMEREVAQSRHLNAIGSLAAGVAHEIRNPLSSIKGLAVYFRERLSGNAEDEKTADVMIAEIERLNRVISRLIEFARPLDLKKEAVDLKAIVENTLTLIGAELRQNAVAVDVVEGNPLPRVTADPDQVRQVFLNLFLNALAAMPEGGRLLIALMARNGQVQVEIADTGRGIDEQDLPRIYDPYFTTKPAGTGLGLAVVQKIMNEHGGGIQIESDAGSGTKVTLRFFQKDSERN